MKQEKEERSPAVEEGEEEIEVEVEPSFDATDYDQIIQATCKETFIKSIQQFETIVTTSPEVIQGQTISSPKPRVITFDLSKKEEEEMIKDLPYFQGLEDPLLASNHAKIVGYSQGTLWIQNTSIPQPSVPLAEEALPLQQEEEDKVEEMKESPIPSVPELCPVFQGFLVKQILCSRVEKCLLHIDRS